jgi:ferredoxin
VLSITRKFLGLNYVEIPESLHNFLVKFKYALLSFIVLVSLAIAIPFFGWMAFQKEFFLPACQICPARVIFPLFGGATPVPYSFRTPVLAAFSIVSLVFLFIFLSGFFVRRIWCRFCPSGAMISFFNIGGALTKEKDVLKCTRCGICKRVCWMQNKNVYEEKAKENVDSRDCILCLRCIELCPENECLRVKFLGRRILESKFGR